MSDTTLVPEDTQVTEQVTEQAESTTATEQQPAAEAEQASAEQASAEQASAEDAAKAKAAAEADAVNQTNLDRFKAAVDHAVTNHVNGQLEVADLHAATTAYVNLTGGLKLRNAARDWVQTKMTECMVNGRSLKDPTEKMAKFDEASAINEVYIAIMAGPQAAPTDPRLVLAEQVAVLDIARAAVIAHTEATVEAVQGWTPIFDDDQLAEQVASLVEFLGRDPESDTPEPDLSDTAKIALGVIQGKGTKKAGKKASTGSSNKGSTATYSGPRRSILAHIAEVLPADGSWVTVQQIAKGSSAEYGDDHPSAGAINAALFKDGVAKDVTAKGIVAEFNSEGKYGARRVV